MADRGTCIRPACGQRVYQRGLCKREHDQASRLVHCGIITWQALEGVVRDGCGRRLRDVVETDVAAGVAPLRLWETRLRGWSKAGVTKTIRAALARLKARGIAPDCECGRPYAQHPCAEPCTAFTASPAEVPPAAPAAVSAPPPRGVPAWPVTPTSAAPPQTTKERDVEAAIRVGFPPDQIAQKFGVTRGHVMDAAGRVRTTGHEMWCRCGKPWDHRGPCGARADAPRRP